MRRVAIIGLGHGMADAPKDLERWGLPWGGDSGLDMYFEMHAADVRPYTEAYTRKLTGLEVPVLMQQARDDVPNSVTYPARAAKAVGNYIESSTAYMLAYAIHELVPHIEVHGVGAPFDDHYAHQRGNLEYLIGFARARGLHVVVNQKSELLSSFWDAGIYGFDKNNLRPGTEHVH